MRLRLALVVSTLACGLLWVCAVQASSNGLRVRAVDPLNRPDAFRIVVEVDPSVDAGLGATPAAGNFGIELADGRATIQRVRRLSDLQVGTHTTIAIDHSLSFRKYEAATDAILEHLAGRMAPDDTVSLLLFGYEKTEYPVRSSASDFSADLAAARKVTWDRHTRLLAHLEEAIQHAGVQKPDGYRQVFLVTDADEESEAYDKEQIIQLATSLGVRVQTLIFKPSQAQGKGKLTAIDNLRVVARKTGGDPFEYQSSSVSKKATAATLADLDAWIDGIRRMLAVEVTFRCMTRSSLENSIRVETPGGAARQAWSENYSFKESPSQAVYADCDGDKALDCPAWQTADAANSSCVPKPCGDDADCAPGTCQAGAAVCSPPVGGSGKTPPWLWWLLGGAIGLLLLLLLGSIIFGARKTEEAVPAAPPPPPEPPIPEPTPSEEVSNASLPPVVPAEALPDLPEVHLRVSLGEYRGRKYRLFKKHVRVGGDAKIPDNDHVFDITTVSGQHAEFQIFPSGDLWVKDLHSSNGTSINGQRLTPGQKMKIQTGDQVGLGPDLLFVVERPSDSLGLDAGSVDVRPPGSEDAGGVPSPDSRPVVPPTPSADQATRRANRKKTIIE